MFSKYRKFINGADDSSLEIDSKVSDHGPAAQSTLR